MLMFILVKNLVDVKNVERPLAVSLCWLLIREFMLVRNRMNGRNVEKCLD